MSQTVPGYHIIAEFGRCECDQMLLNNASVLKEA